MLQALKTQLPRVTKKLGLPEPKPEGAAAGAAAGAAGAAAAGEEEAASVAKKRKAPCDPLADGHVSDRLRDRAGTRDKSPASKTAPRELFPSSSAQSQPQKRSKAEEAASANAALAALVQLCEPDAMVKAGWHVRLYGRGGVRVQAADEAVSLPWTKPNRDALEERMGGAFPALAAWVDAKKKLAQAEAKQKLKQDRTGDRHKNKAEDRHKDKAEDRHLDKTRRHTSSADRRPRLPTRREATLELREGARHSASDHARVLRERASVKPQGDVVEAQQSVSGMLRLVNDASGASILAPSEALRHEPTDNPDPAKVAEAIKQVEEHVHVFPEDKCRLFTEFQQYVKREQPLYCCASCGVRDIEQEYIEQEYSRAMHESGCLLLPQHLVDLRDRLDGVQLEALSENGEPLGVPEERVLEHSRLGTLLCNGYPFEEAGGGGDVAWLGLHADHVKTADLNNEDAEDVPRTAGSGMKLTFRCCGSCAASLERLETPKLGLSNGVDFGRLDSAEVQRFLPGLSDIEKLALAPVRTYGLVAKVVAPSSRASAAEVARSQLKGHMISFMQDALPVVLNASTELQLDPEAQLKTLPQAVRVFLVGPEGVCTTCWRAG